MKFPEVAISSSPYCNAMLLISNTPHRSFYAEVLEHSHAFHSCTVWLVVYSVAIVKACWVLEDFLSLKKEGPFKAYQICLAELGGTTGKNYSWLEWDGDTDDILSQLEAAAFVPQSRGMLFIYLLYQSRAYFDNENYTRGKIAMLFSFTLAFPVQ